MAADLLDMIVYALDGLGRETKQSAKGMKCRACLHGRSDEDETGRLVVWIAFQEKGQGQTAQGMTDKGVEGTIVLFDHPEGLDIVGECDAFAARIAMPRRVEGHHLAAFLEQRGQVILEETGVGFKAMRQQDFFDGGFVGQPTTTPQRVPVMVKGQVIATPVQVRSFPGWPDLRGAEKTKSLEGGFAWGGQ